MGLIDVLLTRPAILVGIIAVLLYGAYSAATTKGKLPEKLPWIGRKSGPLSETRATYASLNNVRTWLSEGYEKYSQKGASYVFPDFSGKAEIVIPNKRLHWLTEFPDSVASVREAHYDLLNGDYAFTSSYVLETVFHEHVIHKNMVRRMGNIIPGIWEELTYTIDKSWGFSTDWHEIHVMENMMDLISRVSNRMFIGLPLCRNEDFLKNNSAFAMDVILMVGLMPFFPKFMHPIVGRLMSIPNHIHYWRTRKHTLPVIRQRLADIEEESRNPDAKLEIPDDYITWHIRTARAEGKTKELDPVVISRFIMPIEFAAIHTTTFSITMALFDIISSDSKEGYLEGIREEAERVYKEANGVWNKASLSKLVRADSALRESMRISSFATRNVQRKIIAKNGVKNVEEGWTAPYGSLISVDAWSRHHDPKYYPNPDEYDAFRFSRPREEYEAAHPGKLDSEQYLRLKNLSMTNTSETYLPFGHGRHAW